ncbi:hypothetical protein FA15DRAFT_681116 [Coprinopsis marcescibilis]|uniref:COQ9 C-terminal domain-containing protein n=1 Tax=Coprinopsis marcescibilis TaxID=230819 RepID=A0A5C3KSU5_COPMA|nr:hypothetical protein FA15DRAFT_681116 [Coprinopsis marcescibilis]
MTVSATRLLKLALPLVRTHGFSRAALARSVLELPTPERSHSEPLSETAVSALFGEGDDARRTLINAWLQEGLRQMQTTESLTLNAVLRRRLEYNEPVLDRLPEVCAFALLATPSSGIAPIDPRPALHHASKIADEACYSIGDRSLHLSWYSKRVSIAAVYTAAELHQLTSPNTAYQFLDNLLQRSSSMSKAVDEVSLYSSYVFRSWKGIIKSSGTRSFDLDPCPEDVIAPSYPCFRPASIMSDLPFTTNIDYSDSVFLQVPIEKAFPILCTDEGHERLCKLMTICTGADLLEQDTIAIPPGKQLGDISGIDQPPAPADPVEGSVLARRQHFRYEERVPFLFGLIKARAVLRGSLTWVPLESPTQTGPLYALHETRSDDGSMGFWKLRRLEEEVVDGERGTRVSEVLKGFTPFYIQYVAQKVAGKAIA